ncbi:MAG: SGNH/GDSL hydrolase family protein [Candidatus Endonucleobacter sp. (ex Gigantidas childressi)]|nr:SGNH/GDSL hydrolase family protein [Candidatus Endonucleobacter sp. (ex Gigantidas childressi)]
MKFEFGVGEVNTSSANKIIKSVANALEYDYLLFFDSRSIVNSFIREFDKNNSTYLIISRPKNLTVFPTLVNFIVLNKNLKFKILITNLGFVDCTPKKQDNINDILSQIEQFSKVKSTIVKYDKCKLNDETYELLQSIQYSQEHLENINSVLAHKFDKCYFINTPIVDKNMKMERRRPNSFFTQLYKTNELINTIVDLSERNILIDIKELNYTYDGVHYTEEGNKLIFNKIQESVFK